VDSSQLVYWRRKRGGTGAYTRSGIAARSLVVPIHVIPRSEATRNLLRSSTFRATRSDGS